MPNADERDVVRPTKRALKDLGIDIPPLTVLLHELDNQHIAEAQKFPERADAGGATRIVSIADRVWFKYKSGTTRAAVVKMREAEVFPGAREMHWLARWWIGAAGLRKNDSPQSDFYAQLSAEVNREGTSNCLLPCDWDERRLRGELGTLMHARLRKAVREAIRMSIEQKVPVQARAMSHYITAWVSPEDQDEAYLTLGTGRIYDEKVIAVILDAVPGIQPGDWQPEPSETVGADPASGEIVFSTLLPADVREQLLADDD